MESAPVRGFVPVRIRGLLIGLAAAGFLSLPSFPDTTPFSGTVSVWASGHAAKHPDPVLGFRYLPAVHYSKSIEHGSEISLDASVNLFGTAAFPHGRDARTDGRARVYRGWARFVTPRFEARLGLQRIDFGSAALLRPLMWFDRVDPRDPLQITEGVKGLLLKYTFRNNANVWTWGLYGNRDPKGWEKDPTARRRPEFGGRVQWPVPKGEVALSGHHRRVEGSSVRPGDRETYPENRIGIDGKWDIGIGLWFEGTLIKTDARLLSLNHRRSWTVGADTTLGVGNGLHLLAEHFLIRDSTTAFGGGPGTRLSALSLSYPMSVLDALSGIFYYDWENDRFYRFLSWRRATDQWSFHVIGFWNPEMFDILRPGTAGASFGGKGIQIMAVFSY